MDKKEYQKQYRETHRLERKKYYETHKDEYKISRKKYLDSHKLETKETTSKYYEEHKLEIKMKIDAPNRKIHKQKYQREYFKKADIEKINYRKARWRSIKKGLITTLTFEEWKKTRIYFDGNCCYCGRKLPIQFEHFICQSLNSGFTKNNILPSCQKCNSSKMYTLFSEWYPTYEFYNSDRELKILEFIKMN